MQQCYNIAANRRVRHSVRGRTLYPLTLGHWHLLEEMGFDPDLEQDLIPAIYVCTFDNWECAELAMRDPQSIALFADALANMDKRVEFANFAAYLSYWLDPPVYYESDKISRKTVPSALYYACYLVSHGFAQTIEQAFLFNTLDAFAIVACMQWQTMGDESKLAPFSVAQKEIEARKKK